MPEKSQFKKKLWALIEGDYDWSQETQLDGMRRAFHLLETDPRPALNELRALAHKGSLTSALNLGRFFETGKHVGKDLAEAENWYRLAAEQGPVRYTHYLGRFYLGSGQRVRAIRTLRTAVDQGYVPSMILLAHTLSRGSEFERNPAEAKRLLKLARKSGSLPARILLGGLLLREWYNPIQLVRAIWLLARSLPALNALLGDEAGPAKAKRPFVVRAIIVTIAALAILIAGVVGLLIAVAIVMIPLAIIILTVKAPLWVTIPLWIAVLAASIAADILFERRQRQRTKAKLSAWPFRG